MGEPVSSMVAHLLLALGVAFLAVPSTGRAQSPAKPAEEDALRVLQEKVSAREKAASRNDPADAAGPGRKLTFEEIEALYLDGKISARQFQDYANKLIAETPAPAAPAASAASVSNAVSAATTSTVPATKAPGAPAAAKAPQASPATQAVPSPAPAGTPSKAPATEVDRALEVLRQTKPDPAINPQPGPAIRPDQIPLLGHPEPTAEELRLSPGGLVEEGFTELEAKMEELLRLKAAREKAASTNSAPAGTGADAAPKTKRERLDDLLRRYVRGQLSEAEYNARRDEIIKEPDAK